MSDQILMKKIPKILEQLTNNKPVCIICNGKYAFASETAFGLRPNIHRKDMPNVFICWECVHSLYDEFAKHITNFSYSLLFTHPERSIDKIQIPRKEKDEAKE